MGSVPLPADVSVAGGSAIRLVLVDDMAGDVAHPAGPHQFNNGSVERTATEPFRVG